jgi:hypothetical protein
MVNLPFTSPDDRMSSPSTVALRITSNLYSFSDPTHKFMRSPLSSHRHFHSNVSVYIVAWKRLFSLLRYRGNATMPHCPIVAQQEAEIMLPRKPNMWQYVHKFEFDWGMRLFFFQNCFYGMFFIYYYVLAVSLKYVRILLWSPHGLSVYAVVFLNCLRSSGMC